MFRVSVLSKGLDGILEIGGPSMQQCVPYISLFGFTIFAFAASLASAICLLLAATKFTEPAAVSLWWREISMPPGPLQPPRAESFDGCAA